MRYMTLWKPDAPESDAPPTEDEMESMGRLIEEMASSGVLIATDGLQPSSKGARVRRKGDRVTVVDGPFTESKELVAGFAIVQVDSLEQAIELTKNFMAVAGDGESEIRLMHDVPAYAAK
jgi:hypothetical protein